MPTIVDILTFISRINNRLGDLNEKNTIDFVYFYIYLSFQILCSV